MFIACVCNFIVDPNQTTGLRGDDLLVWVNLALECNGVGRDHTRGLTITLLSVRLAVKLSRPRVEIGNPELVLLEPSQQGHDIPQDRHCSSILSTTKVPLHCRGLRSLTRWRFPRTAQMKVRCGGVP